MQFHNVDYSSVSKAAAAYKSWSSDVLSCVLSATSSPSPPAGSPSRPSATGIAPQPSGETVFEYAVQTVVTVDNPTAGPMDAGATVAGTKRPAEEAAAPAAPAQGVTMLQPKKKKKPAPAPVANGS